MRVNTMSPVPTVSTNPRGTCLGQTIRALFMCKGDAQNAAAFAVGSGPRWTQTALSLKAAVAALTTADGGAALMTPTAFDFVEMLRPATLLGKMSGMTRTPFNCRTVHGTQGAAAAAWVGQGLAMPASAGAFAAGPTLGFTKILSLAVLSKELLKLSEPSAELVIASDVVKAAAYCADLALVDGNAGTPGVRPASITNGATQIACSGNDVVHIDNDLRGALNALDGNIDKARSKLNFVVRVKFRHIGAIRIPA